MTETGCRTTVFSLKGVTGSQREYIARVLGTWASRDPAKVDDILAPTLMRHSYTAKVLTEMLGTRPAEVRALFRQTLEPDRARELKE